MVAGWDTDTIVDRLELRVGKDLQYVRMNGTLVGFLVGGALYRAAHGGVRSGGVLSCCVRGKSTVHIRTMRTNIEINDGLIAEAMARGGHATKKAAVEEGLRLLVRLARQREAVEPLWGSDPDWRRRPRTGPRPGSAGGSSQQDWALHEDQVPLR